MPTPVPLLFIVDGNAAVRDALQRLMSSTGWDVRTFAGSADCVPAILHQTPDCILSDLSRPAMNAMAIQRALFMNGLTVPLVALTDYVEESLTRTARAAGISAVLDKPCDSWTLETALTRALTMGKSTQRQRSNMGH